MQAAGSKADRKSFAHLEEPAAFDTQETPVAWRGFFVVILACNTLCSMYYAPKSVSAISRRAALAFAAVHFSE